ncbi:transcriptional regulator DEF1-like isoform X3 [Aphidius gifuensis]|uniref:transcriptional regulator DEF1-like isoform X2 n=1 Tax=Aphidius gifuensis TaxID=684658 RepID=UPI001CDCE6D3|nr:transcriptional regulator DEF1-like isoform X2 [Aphidius gifuensis]XP_044011210.1 transcriptional regulator DEF1-like isoform X3 [Aphidius gifuensis]
MRFYWILGFLIASCHGEKKLNLEDIERDNLHSETKSNLSNKKPSYSVNDEVDNQDYQLSLHQYQGQNTEGLGSYSTTDNNKYQVNANQYAGDVTGKDIRYQQDTTANDAHDTSQSIGQYPEEYTQQIEIVTKGLSPTTYQPQQLYYEPEISVGNQYQTIQQKTAAKKYVSNKHKDTIYIPMNQLLAYYQQLSLAREQSTKYEPLLHKLATQAAQQIPIPVYNGPAETYTNQINSQQYLVYPTTKISSQNVQPNYQTGKNQIYSQDSVSYRQPQEVLYTQAVYAQPQTQSQYQQEIVYTQTNPTAYAQVTPGHATATYTTGPDYVQQVQGQHEQYNNYQQPDRYLQYVVTSNSGYRTPSSSQQNYDKNIPTTPSGDFTPPQNYKSVNEQYPVTGKNNHYLQNYIGHSTEPKSLLESYTPSYIIAAKDSARYQERPIKLEGGFLPSKINFIHSYNKRKAE